MDDIVRFAASRAGRWTRIGAGALLFAAGISTHRRWISALGLVSFVSALTDFVPAALLAGLPPGGPVLRRELGMLSDARLLA